MAQKILAAQPEKPLDGMAIDAVLPAALDPQQILNGLRDGDVLGNGSVARAVEVDRVHRRRGGYVLHLTVLFSVPGGWRSEPFLAELVCDAEAHHSAVLRKLSKSRRGQKLTSQGRILCFPQLSLVLRPLGLDEALPGLRVFHDRDAAQQVFEKFGIVGSPKRSDAILAHRLGKRCVVRFDFADHPALIGKITRVTHERGARVHGWTDAIAAAFSRECSEIKVPESVGFDAEHGLSLSDAVANAICDDIAFVCASRRAGQALSALHGLSLDGPARHGVDEELSILDNAATLAVRARPQLADSISAALDHVGEKLQQSEASAPVLSHRDFHPMQLLHTPERTYLIDFDTLSLCDPALDAGNYIAHLCFAGLVAERKTAQTETAFLAGYGLKLPTDALDAWRRATLLRLACIYAPTSRYERHVPELLRMAIR